MSAPGVPKTPRKTSSSNASFYSCSFLSPFIPCLVLRCCSIFTPSGLELFRPHLPICSGPGAVKQANNLYFWFMNKIHEPRYDRLFAGCCGGRAKYSIRHTRPTSSKKIGGAAGVKKGIQYIHKCKISAWVLIFRIWQVFDEAISMLV